MLNLEIGLNIIHREYILTIKIMEKLEKLRRYVGRDFKIINPRTGRKINVQLYYGNLSIHIPKNLYLLSNSDYLFSSMVSINNFKNAYYLGDTGRNAVKQIINQIIKQLPRYNKKLIKIKINDSEN